MIQLQEVKVAISLAFPRRTVRHMEDLTSGLDFVVYRVDFEDGEQAVFRGQRNYISEYLGPQDFSRILAGEIRFYELLPSLPVPRLICFEPDESRLGFPFAFFTFMPGQPISDLLPQVSFNQRQKTMRELGYLLAAIHQVGAGQVGRLARETATTWAEYITWRLRRRLTPNLEQGLITETELSPILDRASTLELNCPRLLHMDFRPVNILGEIEEGTIRITGIVDAANALGGDPAMDLARLEEGAGYDTDFFQGYHEAASGVNRDTDTYLLYRLETAALLANVYHGTPEAEGRRQRLLSLKEELLRQIQHR